MENVKVGGRVRLTGMTDDPNPVLLGTEGTVDYVNPRVDLGDGPFAQIGVKWDNGRRLMLCVPPDRYEVIR